MCEVMKCINIQEKLMFTFQMWVGCKSLRHRRIGNRKWKFLSLP